MKTYVLASVASIGGLLFGFNTGIIAGVLPQLNAYWGLTARQAEFAVGAMLLGAILGAAISGKIADYIGRRDVIMATAGLFVLGSFATGLTYSPESFMVGRLVIGIALGAISLAVPLYIAETAPPHLRGRLVSINQLAITVGILLSYLLSHVFASNPEGWRYMIMAGTIPAIILSLATLVLPESPHWLILQNDEEEARLVFRQTGVLDVDQAVAEIKGVIPETGGDNWLEVFRPNVRTALFVAIGIFFVQQFVGINALIYVAPNIFKFYGLPVLHGRLLIIFGIGLINVLMTLVAIALIDKIGRKPLLKAGLIGMALSLIALDLSFHWLDLNLVRSHSIILVGLMVYIASFSFSFGPIGWVTASEVFPLHIRGLAMSLPVAAHWLFNIAVSAGTIFLLEELQAGHLLLTFALVAVGGWFFVHRYFEETKGLSLPAIEHRYLERAKARKPSRFMYYVISTVAAGSGFLIGYNLAIIAGALVFITKQWHLNAWEQGFLVSSIVGGLMVGTLTSGKAADIFGRRYLLMSTAALLVAGAFGCALAPSYICLVVARIASGFALGLTTIAAAVYVAEIAPAEIRGRLLTIDDITISVGAITAYFTNLMLEPVANGWRYMFAVSAIPSVIYGFGLLFLPESPRWLLTQHRRSASFRMLRRLGVQEPEQVVEELLDREGDEGQASWLVLLKPWIKPAVLIGIGLMFIAIFSGSNFILFYAPTFFQEVGFQSIWISILATFGLSLVGLSVTLVSLKFVDSSGRKPLLKIGLLSMSVCLFLLGVILLRTPVQTALMKWLLVGCMSAYIGVGAMSIGPIPGVMVSEMFPQEARGLAASVVYASNSAFSVLFAFTFPLCMEYLGLTLTFWIYGVIGLAGVAFCSFYLPETKGKTLEEIESYWRQKYGGQKTGKGEMD